MWPRSVLTTGGGEWVTRPVRHGATPSAGAGRDGGAAELWIRLLCAWLRAGRRPRAEQRGAGVGGWARTGTESTLLRWRTYPTTSICRKLSGMLQRLTRTRIVCKFVQLYIWTEHQTGLQTTDTLYQLHCCFQLNSLNNRGKNVKCALVPENLKRKPDIVTRFLFSIY